MKELTKAQKQRKATLIKALTEARDRVQEAIGAYNTHASELQEFIAEVGEAIESYMEGKSDNWKEGEKGQNYETWRDAWDEQGQVELSLDEPDFPELDDLESLPDSLDEVS